MSKITVFLFPGQGSQYPQMGKELFEQNASFRKWMMKLDGLVQAISGASVLDQLYFSRMAKNAQFDQIFYTHPALFMIEYALAQMLIEHNVTPDIVLGSSLGEFVSATVAGILDREEALELIIKQALLIETYCQPGNMLAVLHDPSLYQNVPLLHNTSELVSINYASHFVLSGKKEHIQKIQQVLTRQGILSDLLPVPYAFHSSLIDPIEPYYKQILQTKSYRQPRLSFISSLYGSAVQRLSYEYFWNVIRQPTRFSDAIQELEKNGHYHYVDVGPAGTLTNFTKRLLSPTSLSRTFSILSPFKRDRESATCVIETCTRSII